MFSKYIMKLNIIESYNCSLNCKDLKIQLEIGILVKLLIMWIEEEKESDESFLVEKLSLFALPVYKLIKQIKVLGLSYDIISMSFSNLIFYIL